MSDEPTIHELEKTHEDNDPSRVMITSGGRVLVGPTHKEIAHYVIRLEAANSDLLAALKLVVADVRAHYSLDHKNSECSWASVRRAEQLIEAEKQSAGEQSWPEQTAERRAVEAARALLGFIKFSTEEFGQHASKLVEIRDGVHWSTAAWRLRRALGECND